MSKTTTIREPNQSTVYGVAVRKVGYFMRLTKYPTVFVANGVSLGSDGPIKKIHDTNNFVKDYSFIMRQQNGSANFKIQLPQWSVHKLMKELKYPTISDAIKDQINWSYLKKGKEYKRDY